MLNKLLQVLGLGGDSQTAVADTSKDSSTETVNNETVKNGTGSTEDEKCEHCGNAKTEGHAC